MRIGAFEVDDALRELRGAQVLSTLRPWVDAGSVGKLTLTPLQERLGAHEAGGLARPGEFFDFTRYRPMVRYEGDERVFTMPNTLVSFVKGTRTPDLLFLDVLEPHIRAEDYIDSIVELLSFVGAKSFCRVGSWWGNNPHTRPFRVGHSVGGVQVDPRTGRQLRQRNRYEGPTSVMNILSDQLEKLGIENRTLMMQLPHYAQLEEDYSAAAAMLEAVADLYGLSADLSDKVASYRSRGERQRGQIDRMVGRDPELKAMVEQLEATYDAENSDAEEPPALSPEIERFLGEVLGTIDDDES